ncbi:MAG: radical SAM protein [Planctomycetaceae bacterium]|jgi:radical SAM protein with 4Fe4S-binding SPASM domain|nr:radical SAM protein [Planctomycetaceae bacterium]
MAEFKIKSNTQRIPLQDHIPLTTPLRVFLETSSACNFRCYFCPHGMPNNKMINAIMSFDLAKKCIDDISLFPQKIKLLTLSTTGEPLLNKKLPEIAAYAKLNKIADRVDLVTNASLLKRDVVDRLIATGIDRIDISIYGLSEQQYEKNSSIKINFEEFVNNIYYLYQNKKNCTIAIKICDAAFNENENENEQRFYAIFSEICDYISVEHITSIWYGVKFDNKYSSTLHNIYGQPKIVKKVCPLPFFSMTVHPNGMVSPCCQDWNHLLIVGNVNTESLYQIWTGNKIDHYRICQLKYGRSTIHACMDCEYPETVAMDNIDPYRETILQRYEEREFSEQK